MHYSRHRRILSVAYVTTLTYASTNNQRVRPACPFVSLSKTKPCQFSSVQLRRRVRALSFKLFNLYYRRNIYLIQITVFRRIDLREIIFICWWSSVYFCSASRVCQSVKCAMLLMLCICLWPTSESFAWAALLSLCRDGAKRNKLWILKHFLSFNLLYSANGEEIQSLRNAITQPDSRAFVEQGYKIGFKNLGFTGFFTQLKTLKTNFRF